MLDLEVQPERSLGNNYWEFVLGMPLYHAISLIRNLDDIIKSVELVYDDQDTLANDLIIDLTQDAIKLYFDSINQRLKMIEVYDLSKVDLRYCNEYFNSSSVQPTISQIDSCFGATHPAQYNEDESMFNLSFRGLTFQFIIDVKSKYQTIQVERFGSVAYPTPTSPLVHRLFIFNGVSLGNAIAPPLPSCSALGGLYLHKLQLFKSRPNDQFTFRFFIYSDVLSSSSTSPPSDDQTNIIIKDINFGDSAQDVLSSLGSPHKTHFKDEDKMKIHRPKGLKKINQNNSDYFYNYINFGMDILFDGSSHKVKKFILHTNMPDHFNFNLYHRCNFTIPLPVSKKNNHDNQSLIGIDNDQIDVTFSTKWSDIESLIIKPTTKPVILNRSSDQNPFNSSYCFGYKEFIFEVMPSDHIASITIYQSSLRNQPLITLTSQPKNIRSSSSSSSSSPAKNKHHKHKSPKK